MQSLTDQTPLLVKLLVFAIGVLPLLIDNLRTLRATNRNNFILGAAGLIMVGTEYTLGWSDQSLWAIGAWFVLGAIGLIVFTAFSELSGGVAKTLMALLLWFPSLDFFIVFSAGFLLTALIGYTIRRDAAIAPPFVIACIGVWCFSHPALGFAAGGAVLLCGWLASRRERSRMPEHMERVRTRIAEDI